MTRSDLSQEREEHTLLHTLTHNTQAPAPEREPSLQFNRAPAVNPVPTALPGPSVNSTPRQSPTKSARDTNSSPSAKIAPKPSNPESERERERDPHGRILRSPSQGWYCAVCYTSVSTLGLTVKIPISINEKLKISLTSGQKQKNHARKCNTTLHDLLVITKGEVAQLKRAANTGAAEPAVQSSSSQVETTALSTPSKTTRAQGKRIPSGASAYRPEHADNSSSSGGEEKKERKKRKSATETKILSPRKRPRNHNAEG